MAITDWTGDASNGDFDDNNNWSGNSPGTGDTPRFLDSAEDVTQNLDQNAKNFPQFIVGPGMTGKIGTIGGFLLCGIDELLVSGGSDIFIDDGATAIDLAIVTNTTGTGLNLRGDVTLLDIRKGVVEYSGTDDLGTVLVSYVNSPTADATFTFNGTGQLLTAFTSYGGVTLIKGDCDLDATMNIVGGAVTVTELAADPAALIVLNGGTLVWNAEDDPTAAGDLVINAGSLSFASDMRAKTLANAIKMYGSAICTVRNNAGNIDYTANGIEVNGLNMPTLEIGKVID